MLQCGQRYTAILLAYSHGNGASLPVMKFTRIMDTMPEAIQILFIPALFVAAVLVALWHMHAFILRIKRGHPRVIKGKVAGPVLDEIAEVCGESGLQRGWVGGV